MCRICVSLPRHANHFERWKITDWRICCGSWNFYKILISTWAHRKNKYIFSYSNVLYRTTGSRLNFFCHYRKKKSWIQYCYYSAWDPLSTFNDEKIFSFLVAIIMWWIGPRKIIICVRPPLSFFFAFLVTVKLWCLGLRKKSIVTWPSPKNKSYIATVLLWLINILIGTRLSLKTILFLTTVKTKKKLDAK